jgi:ribosomal protein L10
MRKKDLHIFKITNFLQTYPVIIFLQHNNLKVDEWTKIRHDITQKERVRHHCMTNRLLDTASTQSKESTRIIVFKNTILKTVLLDKILKTNNVTHENLDSIFQGPTFAFGCKSFSDLQDVWNTLKSIPNVFVLGALYSKKSFNHLELERFLNLHDTQVYTMFLNTVNSSNQLYGILQIPRCVDLFQQIQLHFLQCLTYVHAAKKAIDTSKESVDCFCI